MAEGEKRPWLWRHRIAALGPIDWEALAAERRRPRKLSRAEVARRQKVMAKGRRRKRRAILKRLVESRIRHDRGDPGNHSPFTLAHRLALVMEPGQWWTRAELRALTGLGVQNVKLKLRTMMLRGLVERRARADHRVLSPSRETPRFEHRLTVTGEALRREAEWLA